MRRHLLRRFGLLAALALAAQNGAQAGPLRDLLSGRSGDDKGARNGMTASGEFPLPSGATAERDLAYGDDAEQKIDVYKPAKAEGAPLIFMVHGGGWGRGDKGLLRSVKNKVTHWVGKGYVLVSVNYRVLPKVRPVEQATDVAKALVFVQNHAKGWGADANRVVLMGHSAGAHLVSLLASDPSVATKLGAKPWLGTISLDSAAFDVVEIMQGRHLGLYDKAFDKDPAYWREASPIHRLTAKPMAPLLAVCSTKRSDSCPQAKAYAAKAESLGGRVQVLPVDLSHADANDLVGAPGEYTAGVEAFIKSLGLP